MPALATAFVRIRPDTRTFAAEADKQIGGSMSTAGAKHGKRWGGAFATSAKSMLASTGGMLAALGVAKFLGDSIAGAKESARVSAQTAAVIKSTGGAANVTAKQIDQLSGSLMRKTGVDDEAIKAGQNMLLTFTNIRNASGKNNDIFNQSSKILLDMTAAMHGGEVTQENMRKQAIQLGKSLNDPVKGMTALQRVGVTFTDQQKKQVAAMVESGNRLGAQKLILRELTKEFGGSAAAMATPAQKMKTAFGEIEEGVGQALMPVISMLAKFLLTSVIPALSQLLPVLSSLGRRAIPFVTQAIQLMISGVKSIITFIGGLPGPIKLAIGVITALGIAMKLAAAANPWILLATTIILVVGIIVKNWDHIKAFTAKVWGAVLGFVKAVWDWIKRNWPLLLAILTGPFGLATLFIVKHWNQIKSVTAGLVQALRNMFATFVDKLLGFFGTIIHGAANAFGWIPGIGPKLKTAASKFDQFRNDVNNALRGVNGRTVHVGVAFSQAQSGKGNPYFNVAQGGPIYGPGTETSDSIPAYLSNREYVINAAAHRKYGTGFLNRVNARQLAGGGAVNPGVEVKPDLPPQSVVNNLVNKAVLAMAKKFASTMGNMGIVADAMRWIGRVPYVWGGTAVPGGADCSGFVQTILARHGIIAPRTSEAQGAWVRRTPPIPGGLAFYNSPAGGAPPGHVAIVGRNGMVISQGGGMGPQYVPLRSMPLMFTGIPPGRGFAKGGVISEPIIGLGRSGKSYSFGERGDETVVPGQFSVRGIERRLDQLIRAIDRNADATAAGVADALNGVSRSASYRAAYSVR